MNIDPAYEELAEVIARYVHAHLYYEEPTSGGPTWAFNNKHSSAYQIATHVLSSINILDPFDDQYSQFTCAPEEFAGVIARNKDKGCSYDLLMLALICLAQQEETAELRDYGIRTGIFEPVEAPVIKLTPRGEAYDVLYDDWERLADE